MGHESPLDPIAIDIQRLLHGMAPGQNGVRQQSVSLHSYLVTRPTGRAVRMAIQTQLSTRGQNSLSVIDFSDVRLIDYSCADEVVAKLIQAHVGDGIPEAFFVFRGVRDEQWDQILEVLLRQGLAAVVERGGTFELVGERSDQESALWTRLEEAGSFDSQQATLLESDAEQARALQSLLNRGLIFRSGSSGRVHALSRLVQHLI